MMCPTDKSGLAESPDESETFTFRHLLVTFGMGLRPTGVRYYYIVRNLLLHQYSPYAPQQCPWGHEGMLNELIK